MYAGVWARTAGGSRSGSVFREKIDIFVGGGLLRTVASAENTSIKRRTSGFGLKRPGDGVAATFEIILSWPRTAADKTKT